MKALQSSRRLTVLLVLCFCKYGYQQLEPHFQIEVDGEKPSITPRKLSDRTLNSDNLDLAGYTDENPAKRSQLIWQQFTSHSRDKGNRRHHKREVIKPEGLLPGLDFFDAKTTKHGTEYTYGGCKLTLSEDKCKTTFTPIKAECQDLIPLSKLLEHFFNKSGATLKNEGGGPINPHIMDVEKFYIDHCIGDVELQCSAKEPFDIIKDRLRLKNGRLSIEVNYKKEFSFKQIGAEIKGVVTLTEKDIALEASKKRDSNEFNFEITAKALRPSDFGKLFSKNDINGEKAPANSGLFTEVEIVNPSITGTLGEKEGFEFVAKGNVSGISGVGEFAMFVIAKKDPSEPVAVGLVADLKNIQPATILSILTGKSLDSIPLIKDIEVNALVEIASSDMTTVADQDLNEVLVEHISGAKTINKGLKIKLELPIKEILKKTGTAASLEHVPETLHLQVLVSDSNVEFKFSDSDEWDLFNIMVALIPKVPDVLFSRIFKKPPKIVIKAFNVNVETKAVNVSAEIPEEFTVGEDLISVKEAQFELHHNESSDWNFMLSAKKKIGEAFLDIFIEREDEQYKFIGEIQSLTVKQLAMHFGAKSFAESTVEKMDFLNFGIRELKINAEFGDNLKLRVTGNPVLFAWQGMKLEGFIFSRPEGKKMALGIIMKNIRLDDIFDKLFQKKVLQCSWMSEVKAGIKISNVDFDADDKEAQFTLPELRRLSTFKHGVVFGAEVSVPEDCREDPLCEQARSMMKPGTKFYFEGEIHRTGIELKAGYQGNLRIGEDFALEDVHVAVTVGKTTEVFIEGQAKLTLTSTGTSVLFKGKLGVNIIGKVELSLNLIGMWSEPFGLKYVSFGNLKVGLGIYPGMPLPKFEYQGELHIGQVGLGKEIKGRLALSFNPANPLDLYFYADINKLSLGAISEAFGFSIPLPQVLLDTGFPEGLKVGFTTNPRGVTLKELGVQLKAGFSLKGKINILGLNVLCELTVQIPKEIKIDIEVTPIKIAKGLIALRGSEKDETEGFKIFAHITRTEVVLKIHAYVFVLGIGAEVNIDVSNAGITFYLYGNLFGVLKANVTFTASYRHLKEAGFQVSSCLSMGVPEVDEAATDVIEDGSEVAKEASDVAEEKITDATSWTEKAEEKMKAFTESLESKREIIDRKAGKLENIRNYLDKECNENCGKVCVGGPTWVSDCRKILGKSVGCSEWNSCKSKVSDVGCLAKCKAKKVYLKGKAAKKIVTMELLEDAIAILIKLMEFAHKFVEMARVVVDATEAAADKVKEVVDAGERALHSVAKYTRENIINIHHICFATSLEKAAKQCFTFKVNITIAGTRNFIMDSEACLDYGIFKTLGHAISDKLYPGIVGLREKFESAKTYFKDASKKKQDLKKQEAETKMAEKEAEGKINLDVDEEDDLDEDENDDENENEESTKNSKRAHKQDGLPLRNTSYYRSLMYDPLPSFSIRDYVTLEHFSKYSPWAFCEHDDPFSEIHLKNISGEDNTQEADERSTQYGNLDLNSRGCQQTRALVNNYHLLADSAQFVLHKAFEVNASYLEEAGKMKRNLAEITKVLNRMSKKGMYNDDQNEDSYFYLKKMEEGTRRWINVVGKHVQQHDKESVTRWRQSLGEIMEEKYDLKLQKYIEKLRFTSKAVRKRSAFEGPSSSEEASLSAASKAAELLLSGQKVGITAYKDVVQQLADQTNILKSSVTKECWNSDHHNKQ